ncbi:hypothetical protein EUX98_g1573 [Antrodiella citrinella]|uniref:Survival Motor Neuron Gemin2-binding domain-containing protein n=1 Tax=Antrodiella citrinella TaxID=2447956 RepID=A0A4S4N438_9APHY|nr:hypothetical protein EUX98_g1573 [Antrodiella citrinella]
MRPVVSYDDITEPAPATTNGAGGAPQAQLGPHQPPAKRRRTNQPRSSQSQNPNNNHSQHHNQNYSRNHQQNHRHQHHVQHWDEPGGSNLSMSYGDEEEQTEVGAEGGAEEGEMEDEHEEDKDEDEESRDLTHEEIWDDSALIDAWNSASAEYEAYHGKGDKTWKEEPVKKSPLWYNVPPDPSKKKDKGKAPANGTVPSHPTPQVPSTQPEGDSEPIDFNTVPGPDYAQYFLPPLQGPVVSQDEAFQRALSAMYWSGYWTAMYHSQRQAGNAPEAEDDAAEVEDDQVADEQNDDDFMPTQR